MKTIRNHRQSFLLGTAFCMLFFTLTFPCHAQETVEVQDRERTAQTGGSSSDDESEVEYQIIDAADYEIVPEDFDEDSTKPVFTVSGKIETLHGVRWYKSLQYSASRSIAQVKCEVSAGSSYAAVSASAEYNYRNPTRTGFRLNEAYYRYSGEIWDISVGRQVIVWGQADGFRLTDVLSARDSSEFIAFSGDDARLPSDSIRLRFFHNLFTFEAVAVPLFTPNKLPPFYFESATRKSLYYINTATSTVTPMGDTIPIQYTKSTGVHSFRFEDTDIATRFSFFLPGIDFSVSGFYGLDKNPIFFKRGRIQGKLNDPIQPFHPKTNPFIPKSSTPELEMRLDPYYCRIGMAGFDAAIPAGDVTIRLETAWIFGRNFEPKKEQLVQGFQFSSDSVIYLFRPTIRKHQLLMLAGVDWMKDSWTLSAQYFEDLILNHKNDIERPMHKGFVSLNVGKTFLRDTLKLSASSVIDINYGSTATTCSISYALTDNIRFTFGKDLYIPGYDGKGEFADMSNISSIWLKGTFTW